MHTVSDITDQMREHDILHAPGTESLQWDAWVAECCRTHGAAPWDVADARVGAQQYCYWYAVASRDYDEAALYGDIPESWG